MMNESYEILGTLIKLSSIKSFRIEQKEYIYRPVYKESAFLKKLAHRYEFYQMQPYAAIIDENERRSATKDVKARNLKTAMGKDIFEGVVTTIGDRLNLKAFRSKKYLCRNQAGRVFQTYMEDIPALLVRNDGKFSDVYKYDELYPQLGEPIAPAINIVHALVIKADEYYIFYGNGIQIDNIQNAYERLKCQMAAYEESITQYGVEQKRGVGSHSLPKFSIPKLALPKIEVPKLGVSGKKTENTKELTEKHKEE